MSPLTVEPMTDEFKAYLKKVARGRPTKADLRGEISNLMEYVVLSNDQWRVVKAAWAFIKSPNGNGQEEYDALVRALDHYFELYPEHLDRP